LRPSTRLPLLGVCGPAKAPLAALRPSRGHTVPGSAQTVAPPLSAFLVEQGLTTLSGYSPDHITQDIDLVVVGNAISRGNAELESVLERKVRYCSLPEAVRDHFLWGSRSIVLAGTHGKTTTTSLTAWLLTSGQLDPSLLVGGIALNFGQQGSSYRVGHGRDFVIEGDEYDSAFFDKTAKFLKYLPDIAVIGNIEFDHADIYADLDAVLLAFRRLANLVPKNGLLLLGADSPHAHALGRLAVSPVETFGLGGDATWRAEGISYHDGLTQFTVLRRNELFGRFESPLLGEHNVRNALAAIGVGAHLGLSPSVLAEGLRTFKGIKRRLETAGVADGVTVLDDFAHHPTAVSETLSALRSGYPGRRVWAVFEPRSASSCRRVFQDDFARAFGKADQVILAAVFRSSLPESERLDATQLVADLRASGQQARHIPDIDTIVETVVREHRAGDVVVLMSNGGFGGIHGKLLNALNESARTAHS
jgi:UDP-N-acetylmuramate: L-alanyl-gamma-D-glutamyl-meso-diaminopimelate ligase